MSKNTDVIFIERLAHDVVSPLSAACFIAEMLDETLYQRLIDVIHSTNLIKYTCQENASYIELSKFFCLFKNITFTQATDTECEYLKHLLLWIYFKINKNSIINVTAQIISIQDIHISDEEYTMIMNQDVTELECTYHTIYLHRFILACKMHKIHISLKQNADKIEILLKHM